MRERERERDREREIEREREKKKQEKTNAELPVLAVNKCKFSNHTTLDTSKRIHRARRQSLIHHTTDSEGMRLRTRRDWVSCRLWADLSVYIYCADFVYTHPPPLAMKREHFRYRPSFLASSEQQ